VVGGRGGGRVDAQAARHPEVARSARAETVPLDRVDPAAGQQCLERRGNRPPQTPVVHMERDDRPSAGMRKESAAGRFDFGQFWHRGRRGIARIADELGCVCCAAE
jgi:hypothetical protein